MKLIHFISVSTMIVVCASQRSPYAGLRPIGFPVIETTTSASTQMDTLGNRVGETTTTQRLPIEALGDKELVNRLGQLPQDNQPFWFLNWQALEANRKRPQSYPQRPNIFADPTFFAPIVASRVNPGNQENQENQNSVSQSNENQSTTNPLTVNTGNQNKDNQNNVSQSNENQSTTNPSIVNPRNQNNENQNNVNQSNGNQSTTNPSIATVGSSQTPS